MQNFYAVILAGGIGSRFWPVSRTSHPKQFIDILGTGKTLIQATFDRFARIIPEKNIFIITNERYVSLVKQQLPQVEESRIMSEPVMRNTAPGIAYACYKINALNPDASIVVAPSDHLVLDTGTFSATVKQCLNIASRNDYLITLGIKPSRPDTGYGYIKTGSVLMENSLYKVETFTEKPDLVTAKAFLESGDYLWNSGIFIWNVKSIISAFKKHFPPVAAIFSEGNSYYNTMEEDRFIRNKYHECCNISIDYAIMEKADNVYVLPADFGWSDLGTWSSVYNLTEKDPKGNAVTPSGKIMLYDSSDCMINVPGEKLVILRGLRNYIIAESNNTLLICPKDEEQAVKEIVSDVRGRFDAGYL